MSPTKMSRFAGSIHDAGNKSERTLAESEGDGRRSVVAPSLSRLDALWMGLGLGLSFAVSYGLGYHRIFWEDEMLGWMLLHDPSWRHMWAAWRMGADGGGFSFYLTGRFWFWIFGASEISFRFYSAMCFGLSFCVLWVTQRRFYNLPIVAFALFNTWFFSSTIVTHMAEGRFYGLLMLSATCTIWLVVKADEKERVPRLLYGLMFLAHAFLTTSHILGVVYSATLLGVLVVLDWLRARRRLLLYASAASAWLLLLPEHAAIVASAQVGKPHFWTVPPNFSRFIGAYSAYGAEIAVVLLVLMLLAVRQLRRSPGGWRSELERAFAARRSAYVVSLALLLVPLELVVEGWFGPSLFINRYLMPVAIAQAFVTAEAIQVINWQDLIPQTLRSKVIKGCAVAAFGAALLAWDFGHLSHLTMLHTNYTDDLTARLPKGIPVVCEDAWIFTEVIGRQHASGVEYTYLLDWPQSMGTTAPRLEVTQYHLMQNWRRAGYFGGAIQYRDEFLQQHRQFLVLHIEPPATSKGPPMIGNPLYERFRSDPEYQVVPYQGQDTTPMNYVWLVCRGGCAS